MSNESCRKPLFSEVWGVAVIILGVCCLRWVHWMRDLFEVHKSVVNRLENQSLEVRGVTVVFIGVYRLMWALLFMLHHL